MDKIISKKQKIILILLGLFLAFVFGELSLRAIGFSGGIYRLDSETGLTTLKTDWQGYWIKDCFRNLVKTNSLGFHDYEFALEKPKNVFRIVVIGDSQVESLQVPLEKTWHKLLEKKLNEEFGGSKKFEVYIFGHSGNGQLLNYFYLKKYALKYKPDLVIDLFLVENDFRDDFYELAQKYFKQTGDGVVFSKPMVKFDEAGNVDFKAAEFELEMLKNTRQKSKPYIIREIVKKSALATWLYHKYKLVKSRFYNWKIAKEDVQTDEIDEIPVDFQILLKNYPKVWEDAWKIEKQLILAINKTVIDANAKFLLVTSGGASRVHREDLKADYIEELDFDKPEKIFWEFTSQNSIPYLALTPFLRERALETNQKIMFSCDGHWNETGHQWTAEALFEYLKTNSQLLDVK